MSSATILIQVTEKSGRKPEVPEANWRGPRANGEQEGERDVPRGVRGVKARQKGETASRRGCEPEKAAKTRGQPPVPLIGPIDYKP